MSEWISVKKEMPKETVTVLTYTMGDLYPVVACFVDADPEIYWVVEHEGAEDDHHDLLRNRIIPPTHWMPLPELPKEEA